MSAAATQNNWFTAQELLKTNEAVSKRTFEKENDSLRLAQKLQWEEECKANVEKIIRHWIPFGKLGASMLQGYSGGPDIRLRANDAFYKIADCGSVLKGSATTQQNSCFYMAYLSSREQEQMSFAATPLCGDDGVKLMAWKNTLIRIALATQGDARYKENGKAVHYFADPADTPIYYAAVLEEERPIALFAAAGKVVHRITTRDLHQRRVPYLSIYLKGGHFQALIEQKSQ